MTCHLEQVLESIPVIAPPTAMPASLKNYKGATPTA